MFDSLRLLAIFSLVFFVMYCCVFYLDQNDGCVDKVYGPLKSQSDGKLYSCDKGQQMNFRNISGEYYIQCLCE